jgi:hypothetical protein
MSKRPPPASAGRERRFDAASLGRISVNTEGNVVYLDLFQWSIKPDATLTADEAREIGKRLIKAADSLKPATKTDVDDPYDVG